MYLEYVNARGKSMKTGILTHTYKAYGRDLFFFDIRYLNINCDTITCHLNLDPENISVIDKTVIVLYDNINSIKHVNYQHNAVKDFVTYKITNKITCDNYERFNKHSNICLKNESNNRSIPKTHMRQTRLHRQNYIKEYNDDIYYNSIDPYATYK